MSRTTALSSVSLLGLAALALIVVLVGGQPGSHPSLDSRVRTVTTQLRCPVCQGESVYDSPSGLAASMRAVVRKQLRKGQSIAAVERYFVHRYGDWILLAPPASGIGAVLWLAPPILGIAGLALVVWALWSWRRAAPQMAPDTDVGAAPDHASHDQAEYIPTRIKSRYRYRLHAVGLGGGAILIAILVSLAAQPRGSGPVTGTIASGTSAVNLSLGSRVPPGVRRAADRVVASPRSAPAWSGLGSAMLLNREYNGARKAFRRALKLDPRNRAARLGLAFLQIGRSHPAAALATLAGLASVDRSSARYFMLRGLAYSRIPGRAGQARQAWRHFLSLQPHGSVAQQVRLWISSLSGSHH